MFCHTFWLLSYHANRIFIRDALLNAPQDSTSIFQFGYRFCQINKYELGTINTRRVVDGNAKEKPIPAYNEAQNIRKIVSQTVITSVIVVDDGSQDNRRELAASINAKVIRLYTHIHYFSVPLTLIILGLVFLGFMLILLSLVHYELKSIRERSNFRY